jgi:hypothetical protein
MALSIGILGRSILNGTHTVPLQHSQPIHGYGPNPQLSCLRARQVCSLSHVDERRDADLFRRGRIQNVDPDLLLILSRLPQHVVHQQFD